MPTATATATATPSPGSIGPGPLPLWPIDPATLPHVIYGLVLIIQALAPILNIITPVLLALLSYLTLKANLASREATRHAKQTSEEVRRASASTTIRLRAATDAVTDANRLATQAHELANGARINQLRILAVALRRIAELTRDPVDEANAESAENALRDAVQLRDNQFS